MGYHRGMLTASEMEEEDDIVKSAEDAKGDEEEVSTLLPFSLNPSFHSNLTAELDPDPSHSHDPDTPAIIPDCHWHCPSGVQ